MLSPLLLKYDSRARYKHIMSCLTTFWRKTMGDAMKIGEYLNSLDNTFDEFTCEIGEVEAEWEDHKSYDSRIQRKLTKINYGDKTLDSTPRFITSLSSRFCFGHSIFNFFTPAEVFERLQMVEPQTKMRVATHHNHCLAVSNPAKAYVDFDTLSRLLRRKSPKIDKIDYENGCIKTIHRMDEQWDINGDVFTQMFFLNTPIDGYGLPSIQLALYREASGAFLVAGGKVFKSEINLGRGSDRPEIPLSRAIDTFNNEEGFQALRQRLSSASTSWASMNEVNVLYKALGKACRKSSKWWDGVFENYTKLCGRVDQKYGIATMESISTKKARLLPMHCTVADLVNFSIEVASHPNVLVKSDSLYNWVGNILSNEYDLEGTNESGSKTTGNYLEELEKIDSPFIIKG